jgi:hypothetical protein
MSPSVPDVACEPRYHAEQERNAAQRDRIGCADTYQHAAQRRRAAGAPHTPITIPVSHIPASKIRLKRCPASRPGHPHADFVRSLRHREEVDALVSDSRHYRPVRRFR